LRGEYSRGEAGRIVSASDRIGRTVLTVGPPPGASRQQPTSSLGIRSRFATSPALCTSHHSRGDSTVNGPIYRRGTRAATAHPDVRGDHGQNLARLEDLFSRYERQIDPP